ncbi:MAG: sulfite exporter TauE/SafE family protein [Candidatus Palauibacterales bacterium]|nr:sulfite exporter TauE/SafE family protein [Candidatus Palauibacterales bacterium]MDP2530732.1 sulfite exporter TauE/SafE family protein [Candidatus Palauibacterales bacterium]MDP2582649.1 sulfite exporter TauE/SafE family protein [Candidatus Palauibacterales bacterium]
MIPLALLGLGLGAGFVGSIVGIGGGVFIVPGLLLLFGVPVRQAVAASLLGVVATSAGSAAVYLGEGRVDLPLALRLEVMAVAGAVGGGLAAALIPPHVLYLLFSSAVLYAAVVLLRGRTAGGEVARGPGEVRHLGLGMGASAGAGVASGLLGIGGGFAKVPIMHALMDIPLDVAAATSTFMVGLTASASAWIYWVRGDLVLAYAAPVALGVLVGSSVGARVSDRVPDRWVRYVLVAVLLYVAGEMTWRALGGAAR